MWVKKISFFKLYFYKIKKIKTTVSVSPTVDEQKWDMYNLAWDADGAKWKVLQSGLVICVVEPLSCLKQYELFANLFEGIKNEMPPGLVKSRDEKNYFNLFDLKSKNNIYIKQLLSLS